ncbi:outer membrane beta-barrel family protein [Flagellimonas meridianipacifica]|uniref:Outer membrane receptor protein involved in Fe transport n=1 Tax=Flagellimonas meridianipacifica TaxID=1080225 RepID=A0A2T0MAP5_9FLAO|nr:outer membrane beta-barrel family protein [Allomuricauda pacifica]PRX54573.1 outer membrane receptor protein involved in Fe transport [Allomuricauda pacifica]
MRYIIFYITFLFGIVVSGQKTSSITGLVTDQVNDQPLAYASVVLKNQNGIVLNGTITDGKGVFRLTELAAGTYLLEIEFIGYVSQQIPIELEVQQNLELPALTLSESAEVLEGVTLTAQKSTIEQRLDRKVVNVGKDLISQGPSAIDLMNNLPSVNIGSDGTISFRGSENVRILIDGKLSNLENPADVLQQIPSNSIKKIELITNPSAKYNPDGLNGIINIVLKKTSQEGWNMAFGANSIIAQRERYNSNVSLNFKPNKTNFYLEYSNGFGDQITDGVVNRFDLNSNQITRNVNNRESHFIKLGADFYPSKKTILSIFTNQNLFNAIFDGDKTVVFEEDEEDNFALDDFLTRDNHTQNYNTNYKWLIDGESHYLEIEANYNLFSGDLINDFIFSGNTTVPSYVENIDDTRSVLTFNWDYSLPLGTKSKLEFGGEARINRIENQYTSINIQLQNSNFEYNRDIYSSYVLYNHDLGKFKLNLGARFEQYVVDAKFNQELSGSEDFNQELFNVFPSVFLGYQTSEESPHQYQLSYGRRIERPSFNQVNPIRQTTTPQLLATGNITLLPQFSNTVEANYLYRFQKGSISSGIFYRYVQDEINRIGIFDQDDPNLLRLSYDNFDSNDAYGVEVGGNIRLTEWWRTNINLELYHRQQRGFIEDEEVEVQNTLTNIKWTQNYSLSNKISASLFGFYSGPQDILQYRLKANYYVNAGLRYSFANGNGSISLNANDIFGTRRFAFRTFRTVFQEGQFLRDTQQLFLGLSYRMGGKLSSRARQKRKTNIKADRFL